MANHIRFARQAESAVLASVKQRLATPVPARPCARGNASMVVEGDTLARP